MNYYKEIENVFNIIYKEKWYIAIIILFIVIIFLVITRG